MTNHEVKQDNEIKRLKEYDHIKTNVKNKEGL